MSGLDEQEGYNLFCPICRSTELFFQSPDGASRISLKERKFSITNYHGTTKENIKNLLGYTKSKAWVWGCKNSSAGCGSLSARRENTKDIWLKLRDAFRRKYG